MKKLAIIGCGNILRRDDGIGVYVVNELKKQAIPKGVEVIDAGTPGLGLIDVIQPYCKVAIIDSMRSGLEVGSVRRIRLEESIGARKDVVSLHEVDLVSAIDMLLKLGERIPEIYIIGIEVEDAESIEMGLSPRLRERLTDVIKRVRKELSILGFL